MGLSVDGAEKLARFMGVPFEKAPEKAKTAGEIISAH